jgi:serine/threonine protein kinase
MANMNCMGRSGVYYNLQTPPINTGGEGFIHNIIGKPNIVAKIYKPEKLSIDKQQKLIKMMNYRLEPKMLKQIAWPTDVLFDRNGHFVGFIMPKLKVNEDLNVIYEFGESAKYPELMWENKIIIAENLCVVLHSIHELGHVCGDLNPKNISVDPRTGFVVFLDTDSYHIRDGANIYRCNVGIKDYLPVEIQKKMRGGGTLATAKLPTFTKESDNFALAIHIFQLLMNGTHPFSCAIINPQLSVAKPEPNENIERGEFPFMMNIPGVRRPIFAPKLRILPLKIHELFKRAFIDGHTRPDMRPKPKEWRAALKGIRNDLRICSRFSHHQYINGLTECPWCEINKAYGIVPPPQTRIKPPITPPRPISPSPPPQKQRTTKPIIIPNLLVQISQNADEARGRVIGRTTAILLALTAIALSFVANNVNTNPSSLLSLLLTNAGLQSPFIYLFFFYNSQSGFGCMFIFVIIGILMYGYLFSGVLSASGSDFVYLTIMMLCNIVSCVLVIIYSQSEGG